MPLRIVCPSCKASYRIDDEFRGNRIVCSNCQKHMAIPGPPVAQPLPAKPAAMPVEALYVGPPQSASVAENVARKPMAPQAVFKDNRRWRLPLLVGGAIAASVIVLAGVVAIVAMAVHKSAGNQDVAQDSTVAKGGNSAGAQADPKVELKQDPKIEPKQDPKPEPKQEWKLEQKPEPKQEWKTAEVVKRPQIDDPLPAPSSNGQLNAKVLAKVKRATVYIRVIMADGSVAQGSGFFGLEPGVVLTNAHVVGMLSPDSPPPKSVEVTYQSGEPDSRQFGAKILGVDRLSDLAVLRVAGTDLPLPLDVKSTGELIETQQVWIIGFPFGDSLGKNITVSQSSVSSLRKGPTGEIIKVQVNGGMHPGNSGGPVVNTSGEVVGVAVSVIQATQINFAVPAEFIHSVVNGRAVNISSGATVRAGKQIKMPVNVEVLDPLGRVKKVECAWWTASPGKPRPASLAPPLPQPGDSPHQQLKMAYLAGRGQAEIVVPPDLKPGQVIWIQAMIVNGTGKPRWEPAIPYIPSAPVDAKPALLALKHYWGARPVTLTTTAKIKVEDPSKGKNLDITMTVNATMTETMTSQKDGRVDLRMRYLKYGLDILPKEMMPPADDAELKRVMRQLGTLHADLVIDDKNNLLQNNIDLSIAPQENHQDLKHLHSQIEKSLTTLSVPLPGRTVRPGDSWTAKRPLMVYISSRGDSAKMNVTYTFQGVRDRNGRPEGVINIVGSAQDRLEGKIPVTGRVTGTAYLDLTTFQFSTVHVKATVDVSGGVGQKMTQILDSRMDRTLGKEVLQVRDQLTKKDPIDAKNRPFKVHTVQLQGGQPCVISLESWKGPGYFDTYLRLEDAKGKVLAEDDDHGVDLNSLIVFTPPQTGTYRIVATCFQPATGDYLLVVRQ